MPKNIIFGIWIPRTILKMITKLSELYFQIIRVRFWIQTSLKCHLKLIISYCSPDHSNRNWFCVSNHERNRVCEVNDNGRNCPSVLETAHQKQKIPQRFFFSTVAQFQSIFRSPYTSKISSADRFNQILLQTLNGH